MSKRAERRYESFKKYRQRLKKWMPFYEYWNRKNGVETWKDFAKQNYTKFLKHTGTPCSCAACSGESYDRNKQKKFDKHILDIELLEWDERYTDWDEIDYWEEEDYYNDMNRYYGKTG